MQKKYAISGTKQKNTIFKNIWKYQKYAISGNIQKLAKICKNKQNMQKYAKNMQNM